MCKEKRRRRRRRRRVSIEDQIWWPEKKFPSSFWFVRRKRKFLLFFRVPSPVQRLQWFFASWIEPVVLRSSDHDLIRGGGGSCSSSSSWEREREKEYLFCGLAREQFYSPSFWNRFFGLLGFVVFSVSCKSRSRNLCSKLVSWRLDKRISRSKWENFVGRFLVALVCRKKVEEFCFVLFCFGFFWFVRKSMRFLWLWYWE